MENYVIDKLIGEGTYGTVYKAKEKSTNDTVAIKRFKPNSDEQLSKREILAISTLNHPCIVSYRYSFRHEGLLHLVFDFVADSMVKLLGRHRTGLPPEQAQKIIFQLCQALRCCHRNKVIHRDVKPENILIDEKGDIKLCDFGEARTIQFEGDPLSDYVATRWYRPPEQELRLSFYTFNTDIWSVGCILVELLTGKPLFPGMTQLEQINLIQDVRGPLPSQFTARLPRGVQQVKKPSRPLAQILENKTLLDGTLDFLENTLCLEPNERFSIEDCFRHRFLKELDEAEQRETKQQLLERQRATKNRHPNDVDDGIEEEIAGEEWKRSATKCNTNAAATGKSNTTRHDAKDAESKAMKALGNSGDQYDDESTLKSSGPRFGDVKSDDDANATEEEEEEEEEVEDPHVDTPPFTKGLCWKAQAKQHSPNRDGDDIQEIIETDDDHPHAHPPDHHESQHRDAKSQSLRPKNQTHRVQPTASTTTTGQDPYEDDFDDYITEAV